MYHLSDMVLRSIQSFQMRLNPGIIDTQEFCRACHSVNIEMLALGPLFIHEAKNRIIRLGVLEDNSGNLEESSAKLRRAALGDTAGFGIESAGLIRHFRFQIPPYLQARLSAASQNSLPGCQSYPPALQAG